MEMLELFIIILAGGEMFVLLNSEQEKVSKLIIVNEIFLIFLFLSIGVYKYLNSTNFGVYLIIAFMLAIGLFYSIIKLVKEQRQK